MLLRRRAHRHCWESPGAAVEEHGGLADRALQRHGHALHRHLELVHVLAVLLVREGGLDEALVVLEQRRLPAAGRLDDDQRRRAVQRPFSDRFVTNEISSVVIEDLLLSP